MTSPSAADPPDEPTYEDAILSYVMYAATGKQEYQWAVDAAMDWMSSGQWSDLWRFTLDVVKAADSSDPDVFAFIGAGPLEDILAYAGDQFIDAVEAEARASPRFRSVLACVWQNRMSDALYARVVAASAEERPA